MQPRTTSQNIILDGVCVEAHSGRGRLHSSAHEGISLEIAGGARAPGGYLLGSVRQVNDWGWRTLEQLKTVCQEQAQHLRRECLPAEQEGGC